MILQELAKNVDAYRAAYLHKLSSASARPPDFNQAFGNASYDEDASRVDGFRASRGRGGSWFRRLLEDEVFFSRFQNRYRAIRADALSDEALSRFVESEGGRLRDAAARNFDRWPILGEVVLGNPDPPPESFEEGIEQLEGWLHARTRWMDEELSVGISSSESPN
jgi:hypothetical protein